MVLYSGKKKSGYLQETLVGCNDAESSKLEMTQKRANKRTPTTQEQNNEKGSGSQWENDRAKRDPLAGIWRGASAL